MNRATISPSAKTLADLERELLQLPPEVQARLAEVLTNNVRRHYESVWAEEAERRYEAFLRGELQAIPAKEALAELRAKMLK